MHDADLGALRGRLARRIGRDFVVLGATPLAFVWWQVAQGGYLLPNAAILSAGFAACAWAALGAAGAMTRVALVLGGCSIVPIVSSVTPGLGPGAAGGAAVVCVFAAFLTGPRPTVGVLAGYAVWFLAVGALHRSAPAVSERGLWILDAAQATNWTRAFLTLAAFALVSLPALVEHLRALTAATRRKQQLLVAAVEEEQKRAQATAERARAEAEQRDATGLNVLGLVGGGFAHRSGNLLQAIRTEIELLATSSSVVRGELVEQGLRDMAEAVGAAATVLQRLVGMAGRDIGAPDRRLDLAEFAQTTKRQLGKLEGIDVVVRVEPCPAAGVDGSALHGVLLNLALNARDSMPAGGVLTLAARRATDAEERETGCQAALDVADTGRGMDGAILGRLFQPFFTTKGIAGTGVGLSAARRVLEAVGGQMRVASAVGKGTTFTLLLPAAGDAPAPARASSPPAPLASGEALVLVVDDDPAIRRGWRAVLLRHGLEILEAASVDEALSLVRSHRIALAWMDAEMPGSPTRDLIEELRRTQPNARLVVCSGLVEEDLLRRDLRAGEIEFVAKPCPLPVFVDRVFAAVRAFSPS
jgi:signal transduction histidine kinase/CheY-like chemotaxis protein